MTDELSHEQVALARVAAGNGGAHWTYPEWVDLLGGHFFTPERARIPVTYFVDDEILATLSGLPPGAAADSLVQAISGHFGDLTKRGPYDDIVLATGAWERGGSEGYPRCLPLLALAVLAGTRMAADGQVHKNNYYERYRKLVGLDGGGQPPGYDRLPELWSAYSRWLDESLDGSLGISTVREHPFYVYIGSALSQALFRASDRHELTHFLDSLGAPITDAMTGAHLVALLRSWAAWRGRFSDGARLLIKDPAYAEQLELLIRDVARRWDGNLLDELGRRESRILLHWNWEDGEPLTTIAERPEGYPESVTIGSGSDRRVLRPLPGTRFYRGTPVDVDAGLLEYGRRIPGAHSFRLSSSGVHLLAENPEVPGWSSTRRFRWGKPHLLITEAAAAADFKALLETGAEPGFSGPRPNGSLPNGWVAFRSITPTGDAPRAWDGSPLGQLLPIESPRASLVNGLRLTRGRVYLVGGEPDLVCPAESFEIDGARVASVPGSVVPLRGCGLRPGRHAVCVGQQSLRFALARGSAAMPRAAEPVTLHLGGGANLSGASAPDDWARERWTWPLRAKQQYLAVGARPGNIAKLARQPQVARTVGAIWSPEHETEIPFEPVWIVVFDRGAGRTVRLVRALEPEPPTKPFGISEKSWARLFMSRIDGVPELWARYRLVAAEVLGADGTD